jgi:tRNA threonylcarbamoyladenosine biosynthesis protein TsaB
VALAHGDDLLAVRHLDEARRHARDLAPALARLLAEQGWRARELDAVFVSRGPGSYTGLRVGIMSAKTLAYATGCILLGIDTFAAVAHQAPPEADRIDVLADGQQGKVYVQSFQRAASEWQAATALAIERFEDWLARRRESTWVSGPGLATYRERIPKGVPVVAAADWNPRAETLLALGLRRYRRGERDHAWSLEPLYLRPSAAEEQRQGQGRAPQRFGLS